MSIVYVNLFSRSVRASSAPWSSTLTKPLPACSVRSRPSFVSRSLRSRVGVATRTSEIFSAGAFASPVEPTLRRARCPPPDMRQAWTTSRVPFAASPSATSSPPNDEEPATSLPLVRSKTARSQSPRPAPSSSARTHPDAGTVALRVRTPGPAPSIRSLQLDAEVALRAVTLDATRSAPHAGAARRMVAASVASVSSFERVIEAWNAPRRPELAASAASPSYAGGAGALGPHAELRRAQAAGRGPLLAPLPPEAPPLATGDEYLSSRAVDR